MSIRIAIWCSNNLFCEGLKKLLENERNIEVIASFTAENGMSADIDKMLSLNPDVILANLSADFNFLQSIPKDSLSRSRSKIILIGDRTVRLMNDNQMKALIMKGVVGILPPGADADLMKKALTAVFDGELWLERDMLMKILTSMKNQEKRLGLAKREKEIVSHICQGFRNKEIAQKLNISEQTVKSHCNRIYKKLGVSDRLQLALYSFQIWDKDIKS
jgi:DNA-binding NarL/FixJ family response regulator